MSFGKRGTGEGHPARSLVPPPALVEPASGGVGRMKVANAGGIDKGFIALALGVVVVSAGAALAAPSVLDMLGGNGAVRPLNVVVAGLDHDQAKAALAGEAFPDSEGRAFMSSLASNFPADHARLLDKLADTAMTEGADRDDLVEAMSEWSLEFAPSHLQAIGRTGAEGFDSIMTVATDSLHVVEKAAGGCTLANFEKFTSSPQGLADLAAYGGDGYKVGMHAGRVIVDLAAKGSHAGPVQTKLTRDDEAALQSTFFSLMMDKQVMGMLAGATNGGQPVGYGADAVNPANVDVCQLGRTVLVKLKQLPQQTKARILALGTSGLDPSMLASLSQISKMQRPGSSDSSSDTYGTFSAGPSSSRPSSSPSSITNPKITLQFKGPGLGH